MYSSLRIIPVQRHVSGSISLCTEDGYFKWIHTITKFQMRGVSTYKQLNWYWYLSWKTETLRWSQPLFLAPNFSKLFSRAVSIERRLADGLSAEKCFFSAITGHTGTRLFLLYPGFDSDRLQQGRPSLLFSSTYWTSPTWKTSEMRTAMRGAASPTADDSTVSSPNQRSQVSFTLFLCGTTFSRHDSWSATTGSASTLIAPLESNSELCRTTTAAVTAVFDMLIPVSEEKFLCKQRMTHKVLHTCYCPLHFLMVDCNTIQRHSKNGMQLWGTAHH